MIISLHSFLWDYNHLAGNGFEVLTAQQSALYLLFVKYCSNPSPPIHLALFWRHFLIGFSSSPPFLCLVSESGGYETQVKPAELVHY